MDNFGQPLKVNNFHEGNFGMSKLEYSKITVLEISQNKNLSNFEPQNLANLC